MTRRIVMAIGALAVAAQAAGAQGAGAQGACADMQRFFAKPPKLGQWAEMRLDMKKDEGKKPLVMRVGFVDREERGAQEMYRMQMTMTGKDGKRQVMQMLTPWGPGAFNKDHDTEMVMKMGDQPAVVMPIKGGKNQPGMSDLRKECARVSFVGKETIEVPAGTFEARHYTGPEGDTWISMDVPAWRMVKMVTKDGDTMVLTATGDGETNQITEKPTDIKAMMGGGMKRRMDGNQDKEAK